MSSRARADAWRGSEYTIESDEEVPMAWHGDISARCSGRTRASTFTRREKMSVPRVFNRPRRENSPMRFPL